jgi:Bacteriophage Mu Gam like protein
MSNDFSVHDLDSLEWYVDKLATIQDKKARVKAQAEAMIKDLDRDAESLNFQFEDQARKVLRDHLEFQRLRTRHLKFLSGTVGFRTIPARVTVGNTGKALEWLQTHAPETLLARTPAPDGPRALEQRVNAHALAQRFKASDDGLTDSGSGERLTVPGLSIEPSRERFNLTSARDRDD